MHIHYLKQIIRRQAFTILAASLVVLALCILVACREGRPTTGEAVITPLPSPTPTHLPLVLEEMILPDDAVAGYHYFDFQHPQRCTASAACSDQFVAHTCLTCPGGKIVFSKGCSSAPGFVKALDEQGLCSQAHMLGSGYVSLYSGECMPETAFCLVPYGLDYRPGYRAGHYPASWNHRSPGR